MNTPKTTFLLTLLTLIIVALGARFGGQNGVVYAFVVAAVMNFVAYFFSDKIALMANGAQLVSREQLPQVYGIVEKLTQRIGLPMPRIYLIPTLETCSPRIRLRPNGLSG